LRALSSKNSIKEGDPPKFKAINGLGVGAFSIVLKVEDVQNNGKHYAMKKISKSNYSHSWKSKRKLKNEIETMEELAPSSFVVCYDYIFEDHSYLYLVSEQLYGDLFYHLSTRMKPKTNTTGGELVSKSVFSESECQILLAEICLALEHMHFHHFLHRDLKVSLYPSLPPSPLFHNEKLKKINNKNNNLTNLMFKT
jgi:serine/threonine kinase 38